MVHQSSATLLNCHRDHIRLVHSHAMTKANLSPADLSLSKEDLYLSPAGLCRCQAQSTTSYPSQDTAQVDMAQGLHLWSALILAKGAHLADAPDQGLRHTSLTENPGEVRDTVREVTVQRLLLILSLAQTTGLAPLLSNHQQ